MTVSYNCSTRYYQIVPPDCAARLVEPGVVESGPGVGAQPPVAADVVLPDVDVRDGKEGGVEGDCAWVEHGLRQGRAPPPLRTAGLQEAACGVHVSEGSPQQVDSMVGDGDS